MRTIAQIAILAAAAVLTAGHPNTGKTTSSQESGKTATAQSHVTTSGSYGMILGIDQTSYRMPASPVTKPHIHAVMSVFNHTGAPISFMAGGQQYEWQIVDASGNIVWDYAKGRMFPMFIIKRTLTEKGLSYSYDVPLQNQDGTALTPGRYTLRGRVTNKLNLAAEIGFAVTQ
ncbi:MAG: BsuPI-related putative proteinase inhibitor [Capsulimonas sp.]|uniref:BsuPI-related putative proteinase inhibitor n=1 Tax=Capsulimonas sp. TaxID=2494211 RepID=UPI003267D4C0